MNYLSEKLRVKLYYVIIIFLLFLGVFLRVYLFSQINVFEDDECRLAITLLDKSFWQVFCPLGDAQSAPPIFVLIEKVIGTLFGYSERMMKSIPLIAGIASLFVFYKFTASYFRSRLSVILSLFLFVAAQPLIHFSTIFKQYSTDVLIGLICLYYLPKINITDLSTRNLVFLLLCLILLPFISYPSFFYIIAFFVLNIINNYSNKLVYQKILALMIPLGIVFGVYYFYTLLPEKLNLDLYFPEYWNNGFCTFSLSGLVRIFVINMHYFFVPNKIVATLLVLVIWGCIDCFKTKNNTSFYILLLIIIIVMASVLHIYPFLSRVALYSLPFFIILAIKPLDKLRSNSKLYWVVLLLVVLSFFRYDINHMKRMTDVEQFVSYSPKILMDALREKYNPQEDIILVNPASSASFLFYSSKLAFYPENVFVTEKNFTKTLENLPENINIWIYFVKDYRMLPIKDILQEWLSDKQVLYSLNKYNSYLYCVRL